jgi:hypothetical protein
LLIWGGVFVNYDKYERTFQKYPEKSKMVAAFAKDE